MTIKNQYPLPWIDDLFHQLHGVTICLKINLKSGYHQVGITDEYIFKTTFRTHYGHYEFVMMPFGLTKTPVVFMYLMNNILSNYMNKFVVVFINDILIYSKNEQEHEGHLRIILHVLREQQLYAKFGKCDFFKDKIQYLGHVVSKDGISIDPKKIKAITEWLFPKNVSDIRSFMAITAYYQKFIEGFSKIAYPITSLQKKGKCLNGMKNAWKYLTN